MTTQKTVLSAIQPTNVPTLGNYLGAIRNWVKMQKDYNCYFFAVDLHAITAPMSKDLLEITYESLAYYLATGLDPNESVLFIQSHVPEHAELHLLLSMVTPLGWLERVPSFKDRGAKIGVTSIVRPIVISMNCPTVSDIKDAESALPTTSKPNSPD